MLFVVPCRYDPERPVIYECIEGIQRWHPDARIVVIDSDSADRSYMDWCADRGCAVADIHNTGYATAAWAWAVRNYPDESFYALMFDSLILQGNIDHLQGAPVTAIRHWSNRDHDWGWDANGDHLSIWGNKQLHRMGIEFPNEYHGMMGPIMFVQHHVVEELDEIGFWDTVVPSVYEHCAVERVAGICLEALGYDVTQSLQGVHTSHWAEYDETLVHKHDLCRP